MVKKLKLKLLASAEIQVSGDTSQRRYKLTEIQVGGDTSQRRYKSAEIQVSEVSKTERRKSDAESA